LARALRGQPPRYSSIAPARRHGTHACAVSGGDAWRRQQGDQITAADAWKSGGALFITGDEDDSNGDKRVLTLVIAPGMSHRSSTRAYTHYSLLATIEDLLGVKRLGQTAKATPMSDLIQG